MFVYTLIISRLVYCNILHYDLPSNILARLQSILNSAAQLIHKPPCSFTTSLVCQSLYWHPHHFLSLFQSDLLLSWIKSGLKSLDFKGVLTMLLCIAWSLKSLQTTTQLSKLMIHESMSFH